MKTQNVRTERMYIRPSKTVKIRGVLYSLTTMCAIITATIVFS